MPRAEFEPTIAVFKAVYMTIHTLDRTATGTGQNLFRNIADTNSDIQLKMAARCYQAEAPLWSQPVQLGAPERCGLADVNSGTRVTSICYSQLPGSGLREYSDVIKGSPFRTPSMCIVRTTVV